MDGLMGWSRATAACVLAIACGPDVEVVDPDALVLAVRTSERLELHALDGHSHRDLGPSGWVEPPLWTPSGDAIVFPARDGHLMVHDVALDETRTATADPRRIIELASSPSGDRVLVTHGERDAAGVALIDLASGELQEITPAGSRDRAVRWSPRGDRFMFHRVFDEWIAEPTMVMVAEVGPAGAGTPVRLTDIPEDELVSESAWWSYDGSWMLVADGHPESYGRVIARSDEVERVVLDGMTIARLAMSPHANQMFVSIDRMAPGVTFEFAEALHDLDEGTVVEFEEEHGAVFWRSASWSPTRDEIAYTIDVDDGFSLRLLDLGVGEARELARFEKGMTSYSMDFSPDGERIAVSLEEVDSGRAELVVVDRMSGEVERVLERANEQLTFVGWRRDGATGS
ncbi:MAG TPA: hypothetical protein VG755_18230 [Nannocystaceae bacterium]|nr:hypothetical protein [Nannocystaceae bacterium]